MYIKIDELIFNVSKGHWINHYETGIGKKCRISLLNDFDIFTENHAIPKESKEIVTI